MEQEEKEYRISQGLDTVDIGSVALLRKQVVKLAKEAGYRTGDFYKMPHRQLYAIFQKLNSRKCHQ